MSADNTTSTWRPCSTCKSPITLGTKYYVCNVSTCNTRRTNYVFCSIECFERHLPGARHKDAFAVEETAPLTAPTSPKTEATGPQRRIIRQTPQTPPKPFPTAKTPQEVLVVASRLKNYIHARSEMNTAGSVLDVLSEHIRQVCDRAIEEARRDGRKTVMDRDFEFLKS